MPDLKVQHDLMDILGRGTGPCIVPVHLTPSGVDVHSAVLTHLYTSREYQSRFDQTIVLLLQAGF